MNNFLCKKYQIIYADPPWRSSPFSRSARPRSVETPYKRMADKEIEELSIIQKVFNPDGCHLFLWATHHKLPSALKIMKLWGFKYHCLITWDKTYGFVPYSFCFSTEFCLYGQLEGKWIRLKKTGLKTLITERPKAHSQKPESMRRLIVEACGDLPRIELFARIKYPGWDVWGDEAGTIPNDFLL